MARLGASAMRGLHTPRYKFAGPSFLMMSLKIPSMDVAFPPVSCCLVFATYRVCIRKRHRYTGFDRTPRDSKLDSAGSARDAGLLDILVARVCSALLFFVPALLRIEGADQVKSQRPLGNYIPCPTFHVADPVSPSFTAEYYSTEDMISVINPSLLYCT